MATTDIKWHMLSEQEQQRRLFHELERMQVATPSTDAPTPVQTATKRLGRAASNSYEGLGEIWQVGRSVFKALDAEERWEPYSRFVRALASELLDGERVWVRAEFKHGLLETLTISPNRLTDLKPGVGPINVVDFLSGDSQRLPYTQDPPQLFEVNRPATSVTECSGSNPIGMPVLGRRSYSDYSSLERRLLDRFGRTPPAWRQGLP